MVMQPALLSCALDGGATLPCTPPRPRATGVIEYSNALQLATAASERSAVRSARKVCLRRRRKLGEVR